MLIEGRTPGAAALSPLYDAALPIGAPGAWIREAITKLFQEEQGELVAGELAPAD